MGKINSIILISLQLSCFSIGDHQTVSQPIVIYGESRTDHQTHQKIVDEIIKTKPAIVFHTGDLVEDGLIVLSTVSQEEYEEGKEHKGEGEDKTLSLETEIKKYKNIKDNLKIVNLESILKNL
jgi:hypothetical protein